jgi:hypothetical protein
MNGLASLLGLVGVVGGALIAAPVAAQPAVPAPPDGATASADAAPAAKERRRVPDTLMFTIDEFNDIKDRMAGGDITEQARQEAMTAESLYLGSIMYYGPKDWTIWINGTPIGPDQDFLAFQVTGISPRHVELLVPLSVQGMRPVRLEPNQTFISESGLIVEGKYP